MVATVRRPVRGSRRSLRSHRVSFSPSRAAPRPAIQSSSLGIRRHVPNLPTQLQRRLRRAPGFPLPRSAPSMLRLSGGQDGRVVLGLRCRHDVSHRGRRRRHRHQGSTPLLCLHFRSTLPSVRPELPSSVLTERAIGTFDRSRFTPARSLAAAASPCRSRRYRFSLHWLPGIFRL